MYNMPHVTETNAAIYNKKVGNSRPYAGAAAAKQLESHAGHSMFDLGKKCLSTSASKQRGSRDRRKKARERERLRER